MDIKPIFSNIIVLPYEENPYIQRTTKSGFLINDEVFDNPDTGERDILVQEIVCCKVIEVGPDCKYVKKDDDVFINIRTTRPVPFERKGYILCNEQGVMAVAGEHLQERFN